MKIYGYRLEFPDYLMLIFGVANLAWGLTYLVMGYPSALYWIQLALGCLLLGMLTHQVWDKTPRRWKNQGKG